jgi:hypothetical protein
MRGEYIQVLDDDNNNLVSYMDKNGFFTNGVVAASSVIYPYGTEEISFRWDGSDLYVVIDGATEYLLSAGGGSPAVSPAVSPVVSPAVVSPAVVSPAVVSPVEPCPACPGYAEGCCAPATCGSFKDGYICLTI